MKEVIEKVKMEDVNYNYIIVGFNPTKKEFRTVYLDELPTQVMFDKWDNEGYVRQEYWYTRGEPVLGKIKEWKAKVMEDYNCTLIGGEDIKGENIERIIIVNSIEYGRLLNNLLESVSEIFEDAHRLFSNNKLIHKEEYCSYILSKLSLLDLDEINFISFKKFISTLVTDYVQRRKISMEDLVSALFVSIRRCEPKDSDTDISIQRKLGSFVWQLSRAGETFNNNKEHKTEVNSISEIVESFRENIKKGIPNRKDSGESAERIEILNRLLYHIDRILNDANQILSSNKLINKDGFCRYILDKLKLIDFETLHSVDEGEPKANIELDDIISAFVDSISIPVDVRYALRTASLVESMEVCKRSEKKIILDELENKKRALVSRLVRSIIDSKEDIISGLAEYIIESYGKNSKNKEGEVSSKIVGCIASFESLCKILRDTYLYISEDKLVGHELKEEYYKFMNTLLEMFDPNHIVVENLNENHRKVLEWLVQNLSIENLGAALKALMRKTNNNKNKGV